MMIDANFPKMNFIGNKEKLANWIIKNIPEDVISVFDAFSGGGSVSFALKKAGYKVICNDIMKINYCIGKALIENKNSILDKKDIDILLDLNKKVKAFAYENYSNKYYYPEECIELDTLIGNIPKLSDEYKRNLAWILVRRAMIRKMPYSRFNIPWEKIKLLRDEEYSYKKYKRKRAYHNQSFKEHILENIKEYNSSVFDNRETNKAHNEDVFKIILNLKADLIYLDPPYTGTMNNYFGFYSVFDELISKEKLEPFENNFIDKKTALQLFENLFSNLKNFKYCLLSYNNSSYPTKDEILSLLKKYFEDVKVIEKKHNYQITGKDKKNVNHEFLFIAKNKLK